MWDKNWELYKTNEISFVIGSPSNILAYLVGSDRSFSYNIEDGAGLCTKPNSVDEGPKNIFITADKHACWIASLVIESNTTVLLTWFNSSKSLGANGISAQGNSQIMSISSY